MLLPGDDELEEVEAADDEALEDGLEDDELLDFDDEVPAGEGAFAEASDDYAKRTDPKVPLVNGAQADVGSLLEHVKRSKRKKKP